MCRSERAETSEGKQLLSMLPRIRPKCRAIKLYDGAAPPLPEQQPFNFVSDRSRPYLCSFCFFFLLDHLDATWPRFPEY